MIYPADELEQMRLLGYVELTAHGFALPAYAAGVGANAWYYAVPAIEGDHASVIAGFDLLEEEDVTPLPDPQITVGPGDPWQDVFLWGGQVFAGTPSQILDAIAVYRDGLRATAPLSYLDLAIAAEAPSAGELAVGALAFLEKRLGGASGAASFRELVLRPGVLIELRRQLRKVTPDRLPDTLRDFVVREKGPGHFEVDMVPGTAAIVGGTPAAAELSASIARFGDLLGLPLRAAGLDPSPSQSAPEILLEVPPPPPAAPEYQIVERGLVPEPLPNILIIAAGARAAQIARYLEPPLEVALGAGSIWDSSNYRIERSRGSEDPPERPHDALIRIVDHIDVSSLDSFALIVWLADDEALAQKSVHNILRATDAMGPDRPFLIAPAPPAEGPSSILNPGVHERLLRRCSAVIDTTLARSPFWAGQPRRSVDRRMADIVATVSVVATLDERLRKRLAQMRGGKRPSVLSFLGASGKFNVDQATASELNVGYPDRYQDDGSTRLRIPFELRDRSSKRIHNAFLELQPLRPDFDRFAQAAVVEALGGGINLPDRLHATQEIADALGRTLDVPSLATAIYDERTHRTMVVTAETPDLTAVREADRVGAAVVRYTDVETLRALMNSDRRPSLPMEIHLPTLHRYPRNRGIATRGVDTRDVLRLPEPLWKEMLAAYMTSELEREVRRYFAAIDTRGADPDIALPVPAVWNAINAGDPLAVELLKRFPRLQDEHVLSGKRTADLITAWSRPASGAQRWVLEDGRVPAELAQLEPGFVPAQRLFLIDGDGAVPTFLVSRLFSVWARALLPSSTSWASRFQVSKTFDGFPFPWCFTIIASDGLSPPHLRFPKNSAEPNRLADLVGEEARDLAQVVYEHGYDEDALRRHPLVRQIDALLLESIGLSPQATDLDILETLVERNRERI